MRPVFRTIILLGLRLLVAIPAILAARPAMAEGYIWIDVSIKFITSCNTGGLPVGVNDATLRDSFEDMNRWLANTWRGYRVRAVDLDANGAFMRIGGQPCQSPDPVITDGPSFFYDKDLKYGTEPGRFIPGTNPPEPWPWMWTLDEEAKANTIDYGWNDFAINIYFNSVDYSRACSPQSGHDIIISAYPIFTAPSNCGSSPCPAYVIAGNLLHEAGHWYGLGHTFEDLIPATPLVMDVFPDLALDCPNCGGRDDTTVLDGIVDFDMNHPDGVLNCGGTTFASCSSSDQTRVSNTGNNAMSYYQLFYDDPVDGGGKVLMDAERFGPTRFIFSEGQMDRWADWANVGRGLNVSSGRTWFVNSAVGGPGDGSSTNEFQSISQAEDQANDAGGDILLLRPGAYAGPILITKPLTLRATRYGSAVLGQ